MLSELAAGHSGDGAFLDAVIALAGDAEPRVSDGATRLVKMHLDEGGALSPARTSALLGACRSVVSWQAQLHLCQSVARLDLSARQAAALAPWLTPLLSHKRPFVRAWALDALCAVARKNVRFKAIALQALRDADQDAAASVRARARNIARTLDCAS